MTRARDVADLITGISTLKTTNIQHPSAASPAIELTAAGGLWLGGGKILQIVRATDSTDRTTTSASLSDAGISVTITPKKSDSTVILISNARAYTNRGTSGDARFQLSITDNSNNGISGGEAAIFGILAGSPTNLIFYNPVLVAYATPATTSAVTYKTRFAVTNTSNTLILQNSVQAGQMYAIEVAA